MLWFYISLDWLTLKVHHVVTSSTFGAKEAMFNFSYRGLVLGLFFELHVRELTNEGKAASYKTIRARLTLSSDVTWDTCSEKRLVFVVCFCVWSNHVPWWGSRSACGDFKLVGFWFANWVQVNVPSSCWIWRCSIRLRVRRSCATA